LVMAIVQMDFSAVRGGSSGYELDVLLAWNYCQRNCRIFQFLLREAIEKLIKKRGTMCQQKIHNSLE
jgi:hypothetical protein